jgi:hypothetical protein
MAEEYDGGGDRTKDRLLEAGKFTGYARGRLRAS